MPARIRRTAGGAFAAVLASAYLLITATIGYAAPIVGAVTADATPTPSSTSSGGPLGLPAWDPVTYGIWGLSALVAVAAIIYAMDRERRKM